MQEIKAFRTLLRHAAAFAGLALATLSGLTFAQQSPQAVREAARDLLLKESSGLPGKVVIEIGEFDARNQLPPCAVLGAFLPPGTRAWGRINIGVRCTSPVEWTAYVPGRVAVMGDYLVTQRPIRSGQVVAPADLERISGDLTAQPDNTLTDMTQAVGHRARYSIASGSPLHADMLRLPQAVRQGQNVKVIGTGEGFSVANEGRALNAAAAGEPVRVRLGNGQVVSGTAQADGSVAVRF